MQIPVVLMIFVELLALVKSQNFTYVWFKRCGVVAFVIYLNFLTMYCQKSVELDICNNPRRITCSLIIDIYGINRIISSTNLAPYSLEYEAEDGFYRACSSKIDRYLVPRTSL